MTLYFWSRTAASNGTADSSCPWPEGMAPSAVNDSARGGMAAVAKYRDDIAGAIVTAGTSTAYTVSSYQVFDTLAHMANQMIAFTPHTTNGATVTLNVDGLGAKPLRTAPSTELLAGVLIQGTPYVATYNNSDAAWYLQGFFGNPYNIPVGAGFEFWGVTTPNSSFVQPFGQAISRTTYAALFTLFGTTYGAGDGSTTFNVPDLRGRVRVALDSMGGVGAGRTTTGGSGVDGNTMGASGGVQALALTVGQLPTGITSATAAAVTVTANTSNKNFPTTAGSISGVQTGGGAQAASPVTSAGGIGDYQTASSMTTGSPISVTSNNTSGGNHSNMQPSIVCNYIMRII